MEFLSGYRSCPSAAWGALPVWRRRRPHAGIPVHVACSLPPAARREHSHQTAVECRLHSSGPGLGGDRSAAGFAGTATSAGPPARRRTITSRAGSPSDRQRCGRRQLRPLHLGRGSSHRHPAQCTGSLAASAEPPSSLSRQAARQPRAGYTSASRMGSAERQVAAVTGSLGVRTVMRPGSTESVVLGSRAHLGWWTGVGAAGSRG